MEQKIDRYWELTPEERAELERFVADNPSHLAALERARSLAELIEAASVAAPPSDDDLARYVTNGMFGDTLHDDEVQRIEQALADDSALKEQADAFAARLGDLAEHDAVSHFEALTATPSGMPGRSGRRPRPDRMPMPLSRRLVRGSVAVAATLALFIVSLFVIDMATTSRLEALARFEPNELDTRLYRPTLRSAAEPEETDAPSDTLFVDALHVLQDAERSFLGLFRSYDEDRLARARAMLQEFIDDSGGDDYVGLEARYLLAKIYIHEGRLTGAREELDEVVKGGGARMSEARKLLEALENQ